MNSAVSKATFSSNAEPYPKYFKLHKTTLNSLVWKQLIRLAIKTFLFMTNTTYLFSLVGHFQIGQLQLCQTFATTDA
jgi:hypothetical protein